MIIEYSIYKYRDERNRVIITSFKPNVSDYTIKYRLYTSDAENFILTNGKYFTECVDVDEHERELWREVLRADLETEVHTLTSLKEEIEKIGESNLAQDEMILSTMDAVAETYEVGLITQEENMLQDEMILTTMDAIATSYEDILETQVTNIQNEESILVSMDAIAELYEIIMNLTLEIESLKGGVDNGDSNE
jgi:hypothetical protein